MRRRTILIALVAILFLTPGLARAQAADTIKIEIASVGLLADGGETVYLLVAISCPGGHDVLEAFAYVVQGGNESDFGFIPLACDGCYDFYVVRVPAYADGPVFHRGRARATVVVLLEDPATGQTVSAEKSQRIRLR